MGVAILGVMPVSVAIVNDYEVVVRGLAGCSATTPTGCVSSNSSRTDRSASPTSPSMTRSPRGQADAKRVTQLIADHDVRRVAVTWNFLPAMARTALRSGASGYLSKSLSARDLVECLRGHPRRDTGRAPRTAHRLARRRPVARSGGGLTARRSEMLCLITQGLSDRSHRRARRPVRRIPVKSTIRGAYQKIQVTSRSQAVLWGAPRAPAGQHARPRLPGLGHGLNDHPVHRGGGAGPAQAQSDR